MTSDLPDWITLSKQAAAPTVRAFLRENQSESGWGTADSLPSAGRPRSGSCPPSPGPRGAPPTRGTTSSPRSRSRWGTQSCWRRRGPLRPCPPPPRGTWKGCWMWRNTSPPGGRSAAGSGRCCSWSGRSGSAWPGRSRPGWRSWVPSLLPGEGDAGMIILLRISELLGKGQTEHGDVKRWTWNNSYISVITVRLFSRLLSACRHSWRPLGYFRRVWIRDNRTTPPNRNTKPSSRCSGAPLHRSFHRSHTVINTCSRVHIARAALWSKPLAFDHWKIRGRILSRIQNVTKMESTVSWPMSNVSLKFNSTSVHSFSSYLVHRQTWINAGCNMVRKDWEEKMS